MSLNPEDTHLFKRSVLAVLHLQLDQRVCDFQRSQSAENFHLLQSSMYALQCAGQQRTEDLEGLLDGKSVRVWEELLYLYATSPRESIKVKPHGV